MQGACVYNVCNWHALNMHSIHSHQPKPMQDPNSGFFWSLKAYIVEVPSYAASIGLLQTDMVCYY